MFTTLEKIGLVCVTIVGFQTTRFLWKLFYNNFLAIQLRINAANIKDFGRWAVVTGATDGLGKAYSEALAKLGLNIVLISRTQEKLDNVTKELETKYNIETKTIAVDFNEGERIFHNIDKQLGGLDVGVLVNNVGISYPYPEYFLELIDKDKLYNNIINCNILAVTHMCKIVMPGMVERKKGVIINIGSTASLIPNPLLTVYSASKSYVAKFSEDLATEYKKNGIIIQCICPGYVATKMSKIRTATWMAPTPKKFVDEAIKTVGINERTTGYFPHTLLLIVIDALDVISPSLSRWIITRMMENIKARALKRSARA